MTYFKVLHSICIKEFETMGAVMDSSGTAQIIHVKVRSKFRPIICFQDQFDAFD